MRRRAQPGRDRPASARLTHASPGRRAQAADEVGRRAEQLRLGAYQLRSVFAQRAQYMREAARLFGTA